MKQMLDDLQRHGLGVTMVFITVDASSFQKYDSILRDVQNKIAAACRIPIEMLK